MWKKPRYYTGFYPVPSMELLERLDALNILGIGFDSPGPDPYGELTRHHFWLGREGLIAENLDNLEGPNCFPRLCRFMIAPLKIAGSDAAPARAWAEIFPEDGVMVRKHGFFLGRRKAPERGNSKGQRSDKKGVKGMLGSRPRP